MPTIWHPDILNEICSYLDTSSIKAPRLVNLDINYVATPYLFRTLTLSLHKGRLARLQWVAEHEEFAKGVREIIWETAHYSDSTPPFERQIFTKDYDPRPTERVLHALPLSNDSGVRTRQEDHVLARYKQLATEEEELLKSHLVRDLAQAFRKFHGLKTLTMAVWAREWNDEENFHGGNDNFDQSDYDPPPFNGLTSKYTDPDDQTDRQKDLFRLLMKSLSQANQALVHFRALGAIHKPDGCLSTAFGADYQATMLIAFQDLSDKTHKRATRVLSWLKSLKLDFTERQIWMQDSVMDKIFDVRRRGMFAQCSKLEGIELSIESAWSGRGHRKMIPVRLLWRMFGTVTFPYLRRLVLRNAWLGPDELCDFLMRHSSTMEYIELHLIQLEEAHQYMTAREIDPSVAVEPIWTTVSHHWDAFAKACQELPRLKGLLISRALQKSDNRFWSTWVAPAKPGCKIWA